MALFYIVDSPSLACASVHAEKQWWIAAFDCKETNIPVEWDCPLPSDVALKLPGDDQPTILLSDRTEVQRAGYDRQNDHPMVFCTNVKKALEYFQSRHVTTGSIQDVGGTTQFFDIRDPEGNIIEICKSL